MKKCLLFIFLLAFTDIVLAQLPSKLSINLKGTDVPEAIDAVDDDCCWSVLSEYDFPYTFQANMPDASDVSATIKIGVNDIGIFMYVKVIDDMQNYLV